MPLEPALEDKPLPGNFTIAVGFGSAVVLRDGEAVYEEVDGEDPITVAAAEDMAARDPDHDWRIFLVAPLYEAEFQRHAPGRWLPISRGRGFA